MIRIISKRDGFCRCGIRHSATPMEYPDNHFTPAQMAALMTEPMLIVQELPDPPPPLDQKLPEPPPPPPKKGK